MRFLVFIVLMTFLSVQSSEALHELDNLSEEDQNLLEIMKPGWELGWEKYLYTGDTHDTELQPLHSRWISDEIDENGHQVPGIPTLEQLGNITDIEYLLWTRSNPDDEYLLEIFSGSSFLNSPFDVSKMTYVHFHGWGSSGRTTWIIDSKNDLLNYTDCNVLSVNYETLIPSPFYVRSALNVYKAANRTANLIDWLHDDYGLNLGRVHLVGHSLGGQCAGMTGQHIRSGKVARVTGLDPAGPLYYIREDDLTISRTSGTFVDIIHTNGGFLLKGCLGLHRAVGHVDFYPNGGTHQLGCVRNITGGEVMDMLTGCSHHRSVLFWVESILAEDPYTFWAWKCFTWDSFARGDCVKCPYGCMEMGLPATSKEDGNYYLKTNNRKPFALGHAAPGVQIAGGLLATALVGLRLVNAWH